MPLFGPPNVEKLKAKGNVKGLIKALGYKKDSATRQAAVDALGELGDARAVEPLSAALADENANVRQSAVQVLGALGDPRAVEPLGAALEDGIPRVRWAVVQALEQIGAPAVPSLIVALKSKDAKVRKPAIKALGKIGDTQAVEPLSAVLREKGGTERRAAVKALAEIGTPAVSVLLAALEETSDLRLAIVKALGQTGDRRAIGPLIALLQDEDRLVRADAADALGEIGVQTKDVTHCAQAVEPLLSAFQDEQWNVRVAAARALGKIGAERVVGPLLAALKDDHANVRWAAAEGLMTLYKSGRLTEKDKQQILSIRDEIEAAAPHTDRTIDPSPFRMHKDTYQYTPHHDVTCFEDLHFDKGGKVHVDSGGAKHSDQVRHVDF